MVWTKNILPELEVQADSDWNQINPATRENQEAILVKMPTLESNGAVPVNIQDQTTEIIDVFFCKLLNTVTLVSNVTADQNTATFVAWHSFVAWNMACFKEWTHFFQAVVLNVATDTITIDRPFDFAFTTAATVTRTTKEMNVDWSVTPQIFRISPVWTTVKFDITKIFFVIGDDSAMDSWKFGWIAALTKWIVVRKKDGVFKSIFNAKTNGDFSQHCQAVNYDDKAPSWQYWFRAIKNLAWQENQGVVIRLDPAENEELQVIIQDNLTGLLSFNCVALWHIVTE